MKKYTMGIDVGGSKTAYGLFDKDKRLVAARRHPSDPALSPEDFFDGIADTVREICREQGVGLADLRGVGVGMPSFILFDEGRIVKTANLAKIKDFPAKEYLAGLLDGVPVLLDNDAHTAALAEHRHGAGKGFRHMLYCPVSTGISSAIVLDGRLFRGTYGWSGESGHMIVTPGQGIECGCGNRGCLMSWCSGSMIAKHVQSWIAQGEKTLMTALVEDPRQITAQHIGMAFAQKDAMAVRAVEQMAAYMAVWVYNLYVLLNIDCFVFGGGLLQMEVPLLERVREIFDRYNQNDMPVHFKTAGLGENLGIIGAAELFDS